MKLIVKLIFLLIINSQFIWGQFSVHWTKCYGGYSVDDGYCAAQTSDGNIVIGGASTSSNGDLISNNGLRDFWIFKTNATNSIVWQKNYGGSNDDIARDIQETSDGGLIVVGYTKSNDYDIAINRGLFDYWLVKLDGLGNIQWQKSFGGSGSDYGMSIKQTLDGGFVLLGHSDSNDFDVTNNQGQTDIWLIKLNSLGELSWQKNYGGSGTDIAGTIVQTSDAGFFITGSTTSMDGDIVGNHSLAGKFDYLAIKTSSLGVIEWTKCYGGSDDDKGNCGIQIEDNSYVLVGSSKSINGDITNNKGEEDFWVVKIDINGSLKWAKNYGGSYSDVANSIIHFPNNGFIISGSTVSNDKDVSHNRGGVGSSDYWILRIHDEGSFGFAECKGGSGMEYANEIIKTGDGGILVVGSTNSGFTNIDVINYHNSPELWVVKTYEVVGLQETELTDGFVIYPIPSDQSIVLRFEDEERISKDEVEIQISDSQGLTLFKVQSMIENKKVDMEIGHLVNGIYFLKVKRKNSVSLRKLIVNH